MMWRARLECRPLAHLNSLLTHHPRPALPNLFSHPRHVLRRGDLVKRTRAGVLARRFAVLVPHKLLLLKEAGAPYPTAVITLGDGYCPPPRVMGGAGRTIVLQVGSWVVQEGLGRLGWFCGWGWTGACTHRGHGLEGEVAHPPSFLRPPGPSRHILNPISHPPPLGTLSPTPTPTVQRSHALSTRGHPIRRSGVGGRPWSGGGGGAAPVPGTVRVVGGHAGGGGGSGRAGRPRHAVACRRCGAAVCRPGRDGGGGGVGGGKLVRRGAGGGWGGKG